MGCSQSQIAAGTVSPAEVVGSGGEALNSPPNSSTKAADGADSSFEQSHNPSDTHPPAKQQQDNLTPQQTGDLDPGSSGSNIVASDAYTCQRESPFSIALLCKSPVEVHSNRQNINRPHLCIDLNASNQEQYAPTNTYSRDRTSAASSPFRPYQEFCSEIECLDANLNNSTSFSLPRSVGLWSPDMLVDANANQPNTRLAAFFRCLQNKSVQKTTTAVVTYPDVVRMYTSCSPRLPSRQSRLSTLTEE